MQENNCPELEDAERFRRVWQRVQSRPEDLVEPPAPAPDVWEETAFLQTAISRSRLRALAYRQWPRLVSLGALTQSQARRLTAALFLLRGIRPVPSSSLRGQRWASLEESCRQLYLWERRAEADYRAALAQTGSPELRALYRELAGECAIQQQRLRGVLEAILE